MWGIPILSSTSCHLIWVHGDIFERGSRNGAICGQEFPNVNNHVLVHIQFISADGFPNSHRLKIRKSHLAQFFPVCCMVELLKEFWWKIELPNESQVNLAYLGHKELIASCNNLHLYNFYQTFMPLFKHLCHCYQLVFHLLLCHMISNIRDSPCSGFSHKSLLGWQGASANKGQNF